MSDRIIGIPPDHVVYHDMFYASGSIPPLWHIFPALKEVWAKGITGRGCNIASHDTGVNDQHVNLPTAKVWRDYTGDGKHDRNKHGTHTMGTALGRDGLGVAPEANLFVYKILGDSGYGGAGLDQAIIDCATDGCHFANCSYGSNSPSDDERVNKEAYNKGLLLRICSAGNSGYNGSNTIGWPARALNSWCNGAYNQSGQIANFSSGGRQMDDATPGERIISADASGGYIAMSGTSMSAPYRTGLFALEWQGRRWAGLPDLVGPDAWREWEISEGFYGDAGQPGFDPRFGFGILNIKKVINWLLDLEPGNI